MSNTTKRVQFRRGTETEHQTFTGASGELTVNTTNSSVHVHDGTQQSGHELLRADLINSRGGTFNGSIDINGDLLVSQDSEIQGILNVIGNVGISSNTSISQNLQVGNNLNVTGAVGFNSSLNVAKNIGIGSDLNVNGKVSIGNSLYVNSIAGIASNLNVGGSGQINYNLGIGSDLSVGRSLSVGSSVEIGNSLVVDGSTQLNDELTVVRNSQFEQSVIIDGFVGIGSDLVVDKDITGRSGILSALNVTGISTLESVIISGLSFPTSDGKPGQALVTDGLGNIDFGAGGSSSESRIKVSVNGDDANDGRILPVKTIKRGLQLASQRTVTSPELRFLDAVTVFVEGGDYLEQNPLFVADGISIVGDSLRNTIIRPLNAGEDLFRVRNGCYITNISMKDYVEEGVPQHTFDYAIAFDDPFDTSVDRVGYAGSVVNVVDAFYDNTTGITTITTDEPHQLIKGQVVRLSGLGFTCNSDSGITTLFYPEENQDGQVDFDITSVLSPVEFTIKAGISTLEHFYSGGGTAGLGKVKITQSPYVQNCSILSFLGGNGILVDGSKVQDNNVPAIPEEAERPPEGDLPKFGKSMVAAAFTMISFGGIGWRTINDGYAQVVSCFQIFCRYGSLTQSGGYLSITNSATNFGLFALRSTGFSQNSFSFDRGRIAATGISGGLQTLKVVGLGRADQDLYVIKIFDNDDNDVTSSFKPLTIEQQFNVAESVNTTTNTFTIPGHPFINGESIVYQGNEQSIPKEVIDGLVSGNQYYVNYIDASNFRLFEDDSLTRLVSLGSTFVGINTFLKNNQDFFVNEIIDSHNTYQRVSLASTTDTINFVPGREVTQVLAGGSTAVGIALTYLAESRDLIVSVEEVSGFRNTFSDSSPNPILDHSSTPVSIGVTATAGISTYFTVNSKVESTITGNVIPNIGELPETYKLHFHRPSIINSSSHTWEYSGSGTDYNALPQNGGKTISETEQVSEQGGRVYASGTNELGDFRIGNFITAFNRTGNIIFNNKVTIGQLDSLRLSLSGGVAIEEFSIDVNLGETEIGGPLNSRVSTQLAVRTFMNNRLGDFIDKKVSTSAIPNSVVQLNASGQINPDLIPPKVVNFITVDTNGGKTSLVNFIPPANIRQGDTVAEPENAFVLIQDAIQEFLILDSPTTDYNFENGDEVVSALSSGNAIGIVTFPTSVAYGTTGLVKGVPLNLNSLNGGSGYETSGIYTGIALDTVTGIGTDITATITVNPAGSVSNVAINTGGRYYATGDILTLNDSSLIGGRSGGSNFQVSVGNVQTRLYLKLTNNLKFLGTIALPDYIQDRNAVGISTTIDTSISRTFDPTDFNTGGDVDFFNNRIIVSQDGFGNGDPIVYSNGGGNSIGGLISGSTYYVKKVGISSIELHNTYATSSAISFTSSGSGTHSITRFAINDNKDTLVFVNHELETGDSIRVSGSTPTGIQTGGFYYVGSVTENSFTFHNTQTDSTQSANGITLNAVGISTVGAGTTIIITKQNVRYSETINTSSALEENWSLLAKSDIDAANIITGTVSPTRLGSGSATEDTFLAGDSSFKKVIKSVGIGTTQPIQVTATSFESAPNGVGVNTYYGDINISLNRVSQSVDLFSTLGISRFRSSTFDIGPDGAVSIKPSTTGDVDAATLGQQTPSFYLDPNNLTAAVPVTRGGTGLIGLPANGAILLGNGTAFNQTTTPTFVGQVAINSGLNVTGVTTSSRFVSNVATGTAPLTVTSTTQVNNLNASFLGGTTRSVIEKSISEARTLAYFAGIS
jgi:hypothetical protein